MSRIIDDDPPIKTHPASKEYRENWERMFGEPVGTCAPAPVFEREHADKLWLLAPCPCCTGSVCMIDWEERVFRCDANNRLHSFDDIK